MVKEDGITSTHGFAPKSNFPIDKSFGSVNKLKQHGQKSGITSTHGFAPKANF